MLVDHLKKVNNSLGSVGLESVMIVHDDKGNFLWFMEPDSFDYQSKDRADARIIYLATLATQEKVDKELWKLVYEDVEKVDTGTFYRALLQCKEIVEDCNTIDSSRVHRIVVTSLDPDKIGVIVVNTHGDRNIVKYRVK